MKPAESNVQQGAFIVRLRRVHQRWLPVPGSMTAISVTSVNVLDNPSKATNPLQFEIQYECLFPLEDGESSVGGHRLPTANCTGNKQICADCRGGPYVV